MDMRRNRAKTAVRLRTAVFFLLLGVLLPPVLPHGRMAIPPETEHLLSETLAGESDPARLAFVRTACSLTDQVSYFWGGKSHALGWDRDWGWPRRVMALGSDTTGHIRPYGLDCSGLVSWAAATSIQDPAAYDRMGEGVRAQYAGAKPTETPRPGDLAFFPDLSHVGIVLGYDREGVLWVVHCSASLGGVTVTPASVGFALYGVPDMFSVDIGLRSASLLTNGAEYRILHNKQ